MRNYVLQRRWIGWHILWIVIVGVFLWLAVWQWRVAGTPHPAGAAIASWRNYAYAVNWVIFAGVGVWFWWRFMRDQRLVEQRRAAEEEAGADPEHSVGG